MSLFSVLQRHASERPESEAVVSDRLSLTYRELADRVQAGADTLAAAGLKPEHVVGVTIADEIEHLVATLAVLRVGAWQVALATHDTDAIHAELADRLRLTHHLTGPGVVSSLPRLERIGWPAVASHQGQSDPADGSGAGIFFRTSGTTGNSNLLAISQADFLAQAARNPEYAGSRYLRTASIEHNNSRRHRLNCLVAGGTNVFARADRRDLVGLCQRLRVNRLDISLIHASDLANAATPLRGVELYVAGSGTPYPRRKLLEQRVTALLHTRYATMEFGTVAICRPGDHDVDEPAGRPVAGVEVEIVDGEGRVLPAGETGSIRLRAKGMLDRYVDSPEQTAKRFRDGWFWPGDIGLLRADGVLVVKGRADEMIILNGINIFPAEIERILEAHPAVAVAAAAGLKSAAHGDIPVAAVELRADAEVDERTLLGYARERLALRAPRRIRIVAALPRSPQGKLLRREVPQLFAAPARNDGDRM